jgi:hypothetical protein
VTSAPRTRAGWASLTEDEAQAAWATLAERHGADPAKTSMALHDDRGLVASWLVGMPEQALALTPDGSIRVRLVCA